VIFRNKKFVKGRWAKLTSCGLKNGKWLGGIENTTKWFLEIKNLSRGGGQNCLFCGFKIEKWLGGIENSTKWFSENKKFVKGRWANCLLWFQN